MPDAKYKTSDYFKNKGYNAPTSDLASSLATALGGDKPDPQLQAKPLANDLARFTDMLDTLDKSVNSPTLLSSAARKRLKEDPSQFNPFKYWSADQIAAFKAQMAKTSPRLASRTDQVLASFGFQGAPTEEQPILSPVAPAAAKPTKPSMTILGGGQ